MDFIIGGATYSAEDLKKNAAGGGHKPKRAPRAKDETRRFIGFQVVGYAPGLIEQAQRAHAEQQGIEEFAVAFTLEHFFQSTKPKPVVSKFFQLRSAADQCADLARKAGWEQVSVTEVVR